MAERLEARLEWARGQQREAQLEEPPGARLEEPQERLPAASSREAGSAKRWQSRKNRKMSSCCVSFFLFLATNIGASRVSRLQSYEMNGCSHCSIHLFSSNISRLKWGSLVLCWIIDA